MHRKRADRLRNIKASGIRRLFSLVQSMPDLISLGLGEPDFTPPTHVLEAAKQALDEGKTHYPPTNGIHELREALAKKFTREYGLFFNPDSEILVTVGATQAVFIALLAFVNPGDEVIIQDPGFVCYEPAVLLAGATPISVPTLKSDGFKPDINAVTSLLTDKSRAIIINSPNNPTGSVLSYDELSELSKLAVENDLIVVSDEVYEKITYDNVKHHCLATFPGMRERTVVVNSFSKTYAMTGFRVGYALGPEELISSMLLVQQFSVACVDGPAQYAATAALDGPQGFVREMVSHFDKRRKLVFKRLNEIAGFNCSLPKGAFYAFPDINDFGISSADFSEFLLKEARVIVTDGASFGKHGEGFVRLSFATAFEKIKEALDRIERTVNKMQRP
ncbi:MAG: pyridoxal phosphate-dependent aminotransferase [Candidatus Bathyarchaeota archaeon]|nr:MAG: pyridoxal phosphate-dependent aminotransferase [Candidatus Bathyarchaeota archaeon]